MGEFRDTGGRIALRGVGACSITLHKVLDPNGALAPSPRVQGCMCAVLCLTSKIELRAAAMRCLLRLFALPISNIYLDIYSSSVTRGRISTAKLKQGTLEFAGTARLPLPSAILSDEVTSLFNLVDYLSTSS